MSRPRGKLAQALYCKLNNDLIMENFDYQSWYRLGPDTPEHHICDRYKNKFIEMSVDKATKTWLDEARETSSRLWTQIYHVLARLFLGLFMTQTDLNGFLRRGSMFVLSEYQFKDLLTAGGFNQSNFFSNNHQMIDILDIGAGDGAVTVRLAKSVIMSGSSILLKVFCTETSFFMRERLQERKFTVIDSIRDVEKVHLISCLNVLDRCVDPFEILTDIHDTLAVNGLAIFALVLPYSHYVEKNSSHMPNNLLLPDSWTKKRHGEPVTFEAEVVEFFRQLEKFGFVIEAWTKAPYLCEGDIKQSFYWLTDIVVVVSRAIDKHAASCSSIRKSH